MYIFRTVMRIGTVNLIQWNKNWTDFSHARMSMKRRRVRYCKCNPQQVILVAVRLDSAHYPGYESFYRNHQRPNMG
ncbi:hypothetical protein RRG08_023401 [Elysia crispata]|uniref:Uncharacterized protein n=1 Tax=Elysia crispata TaxID=231223 RepID=A0AAE0YEH5_9GAST|nr:hypothetical protein RRG08_023401 [Elysia crispata]